MKYLQGHDRSCLVAHQFHQAHPPDFYRFRVLEPVRKLQSGSGHLSVAKLKQYYKGGIYQPVWEPPT